MTGLEIWLLAIGLAMDCLAVSIASGIILKRIQWRPMLVMAFFFGLFQAIMPLLGWLGASTFSHLIESVDHWIAFVLLCFIGANMIRESRREAEPENADFGPRAMLPLAVATSIDALAVGITFAFLQVNMYIALPLIGGVTFLLSFAGVKLGHAFGAKYKSKAECLGGLVLILIGLKILLEHLGFLG